MSETVNKILIREPDQPSDRGYISFSLADLEEFLQGNLEVNFDANDCWDCPVAQFLKSNTDKVYSIAYEGIYYDSPCGIELEYSFPKWITTFMKFINRGDKLYGQKIVSGKESLEALQSLIAAKAISV